MLQNFIQIIDRAVAGGFRTDEGAAVGEAFARQDAVLEDALQPAVLAVKEADLAAAHADVAGGNVNVRTDVAVKGRHEALAETHDFRVALALGIEVRAALGAADGLAGQGVLESLFKA